MKCINMLLWSYQSIQNFAHSDGSLWHLGYSHCLQKYCHACPCCCSHAICRDCSFVCLTNVQVACNYGFSWISVHEVRILHSTSVRQVLVWPAQHWISTPKKSAQDLPHLKRVMSKRVCYPFLPLQDVIYICTTMEKGNDTNILNIVMICWQK